MASDDELLSSNTRSSATFLALSLVFAFLIYNIVFKASHDPREPPLAPQFPPVLGHILGLSRRSFEYAVDLSFKVSAPIFTLQLPGQKIYVITKPYLISQFERQSKTFAFGALETKLSVKLAGASSIASELAQLDANKEGSLNEDSRATFHEALKPGASLDHMNALVSREITGALERIQPKQGQMRPLKLYVWLRDSVTLMTTNAIFGPANPFKDSAMAEAFWTYEKGITNILISPFPSLTARSAIQAREKLVTAFIPYIANGHFEKASQVVQNHIAFQRRWNMPLEDMARFEVLASIGFLVNTVAVAFSILVLIYMDPNGQLLKDIRVEVRAVTRTDGSKRSINNRGLKEQCPLLIGTFQETLRYRSSGTSMREVCEDTELDGWLLKKGALLQVPRRVMHLDQEVWGKDAGDFNAERFVESVKSRVRDSAFRAFGGGKKLCPGRHFATNEILMLVALFVSRYEMKPADGRPWKEPPALKTDAGSFQMQPDWDIDVEIVTIDGQTGREWEVEVVSKPAVDSFDAVNAL